jgi:hypothetical protein
VQREVVFGAVQAAKSRGVDMTQSFVDPVVRALIEHPQLAARIHGGGAVGQEATWSWRTVKDWPEDIISIVERALDSSRPVAEAVDAMLTGTVAARLDLARYLYRVGWALPADAWERIDRDYRVSWSLNLKDEKTHEKTLNVKDEKTHEKTLNLKDEKTLDVKDEKTMKEEKYRWGLGVAEIVGWLSFAIECPSNSTRRESSSAMAERPLTALLTQLKRALDLKLSTEGKERQIRQRREAQEVAHGTMPMLFRAQELAQLRVCASTCRSAEAFCAAFRRAFADQLALSERTFVAGKRAGTAEQFEAAVTVALTNLFGRRAELERNIPTSCTHLPKRACAFVTCPEFMQQQPGDLFQHLADRGCHLPPKHPERDFVQAFHMQGKRFYDADPAKAAWTNNMKRYTAAAIPTERLAAYDVMIDVLYANLQQFF